MMQISDILTLERTNCCAPGSSKKRVLEYLATFLAQQNTDVEPLALFEQLLARERLGSTGIGDGVAIPHCRLEGFTAPVGVLLRLQKGVDFDAIDGQPVDLVFALIVPEDSGDNQENDEHLNTLASIAELMQSPQRRKSLRQAVDNRALYSCAIT
ncbi:PTS sugar transporter subunit IIA [bacterium SCSIO 12696]|nr:PTS sugar transporter subunit IIA [bacterium SCSIO 12696]